MTADEAGTIAAFFAEQDRDGRAEIARALTVLQLGIEVLSNVLPAGHPDIDSGALMRTLGVASEQATEAIGVLVEIVNLRAHTA